MAEFLPILAELGGQSIVDRVFLLPHPQESHGVMQYNG